MVMSRVVNWESRLMRTAAVGSHGGLIDVNQADVDLAPLFP